MTPEEIEEIRERARYAGDDEDYAAPAGTVWRGRYAADVPHLLTALEEAEARVEELEGALRDLHDGYYGPTQRMAGLGPIQCDWCEREDESGDPQALVHDEGCMVDAARRALGREER